MVAYVYLTVADMGLLHILRRFYNDGALIDKRGWWWL